MIAAEITHVQEVFSGITGSEVKNGVIVLIKYNQLFCAKVTDSEIAAETPCETDADCDSQTIEVEEPVRLQNIKTLFNIPCRRRRRRWKKEPRRSR